MIPEAMMAAPLRHSIERSRSGHSGDLHVPVPPDVDRHRLIRLGRRGDAPPESGKQAARSPCFPSRPEPQCGQPRVGPGRM